MRHTPDGMIKYVTEKIQKIYGGGLMQRKWSKLLLPQSLHRENNCYSGLVFEMNIRKNSKRIRQFTENNRMSSFTLKTSLIKTTNVCLRTFTVFEL